jgi:hypothetical protein
MSYRRTISELQKNAVLWWPENLKEKNALANVLPLLLKTQDDFLRVLHLGKNDPFHVIELINCAGFPGNLFLKHLVVLADYGGEPIQRMGQSFTDIFPRDENGYFFNFQWRDRKYTYNFKEMPVKGLSNKKLFIDGNGLAKERKLDKLTTDMIAIVLFAASSELANQAGLDACDIGALIGDSDSLDRYVKQRYITVSRITGGATANGLGQLAQTELVDFLRQQLDDSYNVSRNGAIMLRGYNNSQGMPFDVVISKNSKKIGIEISFQVTTNSTIERKAGQAADRLSLMHADGHHIAYVIDGAGNFQRSSAISTICSNSDCTVAYSLEEFKLLAEWIAKTI